MKRVITLCLILLNQYTFAQVFDVDTLWLSGPVNNRINLVILGDGYQASELPQFSADVDNFTNVLFLETPYKEYKNFFNVFTISVPSNESGASHPGTATDVSEPHHPISTIDNYFGSSFDSYNIHRLLVANNTSAITNVLANNFPSYDQVIILVNSPYYGGSGGQYPVTSTNISSNEIALHELGHSFVNLADEYYAGDIYASERINMTQETNPGNVKWKNWVNYNNVGIYQHCCGGNSSNWYRPHQNCKMRYLGEDLCPVCTEGTIEKIHDLTNLIDSYTPPNTGTINLTSPISFNVNLVVPIPNTLQIEWILNGAAINTNTDSISISANDLIAGNNQLSVIIEDTISLLRIDNHQTIHFSNINWNINSLTTSIDEVSANAFRIKLFPNPTQNVLYFSLISDFEDDYTITVRDLSGKKLNAKKFNSNDKNTLIQLGQLPSGIYLIEFSFDNDIIISRKVIKE